MPKCVRVFVSLVSLVAMSVELHLRDQPFAGGVSLGGAARSYVMYWTFGALWTSDSSGTTGLVTLDSRTSRHAAGTFGLTLVPSGLGGSSGRFSVTNGAFDVKW